ncbi:2-amino-4-hydroxy-6-hydroxymethyldihydropteridinepyrophosphokinase [Corynebacterium kutscheri]|uniref:2-amino-4-hydroxy-6-hydroxymethyldihydropteridine diphosphokinase n=1 Tax=Corynebacterium kutscheri TaxID=35755 RepID=A0A0F6TCE7_9CORY|nr:2-amino-4-hydroxy-6-hydroxymethyldihydropteridine diphosphokinase [Corynebacterium kutscheri]AKE40741.1 2-amino-4-hydroxy-6-hydroxymethyldihydropteridine diphosphokinase [Corynebacterium kutscheri]VEH11139.1 2-amino-4-hydroxy-6-hydroxymethyldihydropteridinepyrophosphokinase [Corynebacterium kutscheri]VEH80384.1 2-amino-4-hydroxy-6-hydroxymethyldihydropteridinepyrophosphokinase [Corynebacterium kutscheri]
MRAVLSIGSNMAESKQLLYTVFDEFAKETIAHSSIHLTAPWGVTDQADFLNAVLIVEVAEGPYALLRRCQKLEQNAHRVRERRWGPRTLDVDIVQIEGVTSNDPVLLLPHPWAHQRAFVLAPWLEADPTAKLGQESVEKLLNDVIKEA